MVQSNRAAKKEIPIPTLAERTVPQPLSLHASEPQIPTPPKYMDGHQPPSASYLRLSPVSSKHKHSPPFLFHPSTFCKPQASRDPGEFGEGAMRRTWEHGDHWDALGTPELCLQPHPAVPICAATLRKTVFCKPPGQVPAPFPLKARSGM